METASTAAASDTKGKAATSNNGDATNASSSSSDNSDHKKPKATRAKTAESSPIITDVTSHDVLLGRGNGVKNWAGNLHYRDLIRRHAHTYVDCQDRTQKDMIAHKVILQIEEPGGRFLKQLSAEIEGSLIGATWEKIPRDAALAKVRQALRDMAQIAATAGTCSVSFFCCSGKSIVLYDILAFIGDTGEVREYTCDSTG